MGFFEVDFVVQIQDGFTFWKARGLDWRPARFPWSLPCPSLLSLNIVPMDLPLRAACGPPEHTGASSLTGGLDTSQKSPAGLTPPPTSSLLCSHLLDYSRTDGFSHSLQISVHITKASEQTVASGVALKHFHCYRSKSKSSYLRHELVTLQLPCRSHKPAYLC